jgi:hypothetical protein
MDKFIIRDDAIRAMLKEQQDDIKSYGCPIPEGFDGDRAVRLWKLAYERGKNERFVMCKDCINRPFKINKDRESYGFNLDARMKNDFEYYCPFMCEDGWYSTMPEDDFYCKNGERRTYETY